MARYFRRQGSDTIEQISESRTAKPNLWWSAEQMARHGFEEVMVADTIAAEDEKRDKETKKERLIAARTKELAIASLKTDGLLDANGKLTAAGKQAAKQLK